MPRRRPVIPDMTDIQDLDTTVAHIQTEFKRGGGELRASACQYPDMIIS
jgi:hypothetical protein